MNIRRIAAQAAIVQALFLVVLTVLWMVVLPAAGMQMSDMDNTTKPFQFMLDHKGLYMISFALDWVFGATTIILATVFAQRFSGSQPWLAAMIRPWGVISATAFFIAGTIGLYGISFAVQDYATHPGVLLMQSIGQIQFAVENVGVAAVGVVVFLTAMASARTKAFPGWMNIMGYLTGFFYVLGTVVTPISMALGMAGFIGVLFGIIFNIGIAMNFMKKEHAELVLEIKIS